MLLDNWRDGQKKEDTLLISSKDKGGSMADPDRNKIAGVPANDENANISRSICKFNPVWIRLWLGFCHLTSKGIDFDTAVVIFRITTHVWAEKNNTKTIRVNVSSFQFPVPHHSKSLSSFTQKYNVTLSKTSVHISGLTHNLVPCRGGVACRARAWEFKRSRENTPVWIWKLIWKDFPPMQGFCRLRKSSGSTLIVKERKTSTKRHVNGFVDLMITVIMCKFSQNTETDNDNALLHNIKLKKYLTLVFFPWLILPVYNLPLQEPGN